MQQRNTTLTWPSWWGACIFTNKIVSVWAGPNVIRCFQPAETFFCNLNRKRTYIATALPHVRNPLEQVQLCFISNVTVTTQKTRL